MNEFILCVLILLGVIAVVVIIAATQLNRFGGYCPSCGSPMYVVEEDEETVLYKCSKCEHKERRWKTP